MKNLFTILLSFFFIQCLSAQTEPEAAGDSARVNTGVITEVVNGVALEIVVVAGGNYSMGSTFSEYEQPVHTVNIKSFGIGKYEVTQKQWHAVMGEDPKELHFKNCDECPVESVSMNDVHEFVNKLNSLTGKHYRVPSEAEWEYAARGGNQSKGYKYSGSNVLNEVAWNTVDGGNCNDKTHEVGKLKGNELGIHDMSGNVWEWCEDFYHENYKDAPTDGTPWQTGSRSRRVLRGGSWYNSSNEFFRVSNRLNYYPVIRSNVSGFRLALDL